MYTSTYIRVYGPPVSARVCTCASPVSPAPPGGRSRRGFRYGVGRESDPSGSFRLNARCIHAQRTVEYIIYIYMYTYISVGQRVENAESARTTKENPVICRNVSRVSRTCGGVYAYKENCRRARDQRVKSGEKNRPRRCREGTERVFRGWGGRTRVAITRRREKKRADETRVYIRSLHTYSTVVVGSLATRRRSHRRAGENHIPFFFLISFFFFFFLTENVKNTIIYVCCTIIICVCK